MDKVKKLQTKNASTSQSESIKVCELFAGVGGFRLGLQEASEHQKTPYEIIWSNQWEPGEKAQHASKIYAERFRPGVKEHFNQDISTVDIKDIPEHDVLVGGFPCQDYSVARTLNQAAGLVGKKGVLWWQIHRILKDKKSKKPKYLILENVDRLLKSPSSRRGRDFAIMLASLAKLGYAVEWRVINAADYGFPQRRRRVFFIGYHKTSEIFKQAVKNASPIDWMLKDGLLAKKFPVLSHDDKAVAEGNIEGDLVKVTNNFNISNPSQSPFHNTGMMINSRYWTAATKPIPLSVEDSERRKLRHVLIDEKDVPKEYYIKSEDLPKWEYLKGAKQAARKSKKTGHEYNYSEGAMVFPDSLDAPSRTIITGEGGSTPSRFKHVVEVTKGKPRRLLPVELERLNMFPDNHTAGVSDIRRAFFMGNALVVGIIRKIGEGLLTKIKNYGK